MSDGARGVPVVPLLEDKRIVLGVTGSIAAYKAVELASSLTQAGAEVDVILSEAAEQFVSALTFRSVTGRRAYRNQDLWGERAHVLHVGLGRQADAYVIAPATANTLAKLAHGSGEGLIALTALGAECPLLVAPAMDAGMYAHPAVQANVDILRARDVYVAGPAEGRMASGLTGLGRMLEPDELVGHLRLLMGAAGPLAGSRIVVTAGGTQEALDPVRALSNRSSGKQGYALAQAGIDRGAEVTLISAPTGLPTPIGAKMIDVVSAQEMRDAVLAEMDSADALIMAAAVADFRPAQKSQQKIKKDQGLAQIDLEATEDILTAVSEQRAESGRPAVLVGFAAESEALAENARKKLQDKGLDLIVANDISAADAGFGVDTNRVTLVDAEGAQQELPLLSKVEVAERVLERVEALLDPDRLAG